MREYNNNGIKRISRTVAKKEYEAGRDVLFIPCNMNPCSNWGLGIWQNKKYDGQYDNFNKLYNFYQWYNCNNETGKYISFYIKTA